MHSLPKYRRQFNKLAGLQAVLIHVVLVGCLFGWPLFFSSTPEHKQPPSMQAVIVDTKQIKQSQVEVSDPTEDAKKLAEEAKLKAQEKLEKQAELAKQRDEDRRKTAEKEAEQERLAAQKIEQEKRTAEEQRQKERAKQAEEKRKAQEKAKQQAEAEEKRQVEQAKQRDEERRKVAEKKAEQERLAAQKIEQEKRAAEEQRQKDLARQAEAKQKALEKAKQAAELQARQQAELAAHRAQSYESGIRSLIEGVWNIPPNATSDEEVLLEIHLVPTGEVVNVAVIQSSGNMALDRSAIAAVNKIEQFDVPSENTLFEMYFRRLKMKFRPEGRR